MGDAVDATPSSRGVKSARREEFHAKAAKIAKTGKREPRIPLISRMAEKVGIAVPVVRVRGHESFTFSSSSFSRGAFGEHALPCASRPVARGSVACCLSRTTRFK